MAKKPSVLDELAAYERKPKTWFDRLTPEMQGKVLEIRQLVQSGVCKSSARTIHKWIKENGGHVQRETLSDWLNAKT